MHKFSGVVLLIVVVCLSEKHMNISYSRANRRTKDSPTFISVFAKWERLWCYLYKF